MLHGPTLDHAELLAERLVLVLIGNEHLFNWATANCEGKTYLSNPANMSINSTDRIFSEGPANKNSKITRDHFGGDGNSIFVVGGAASE